MPAGTVPKDNARSGAFKRVADLVEIAGQLPPSNVVMPGGERAGDLRLAESARDHGVIDRIVLVGNPDRIARGIEEVGIEIPPGDIVAAEGDDAVAATTVELVQARAVDIVLKGDISTPVMSRHLLPLAGQATVSLNSIFDAAPISGGRPMVLADAGVTTVCNFGRMIDLVRNAVDVAQTVMGIERPRVAILSANEKQIPSLPSTWIGKQLSQLDWPDATVYGPLSFDLATDPGSVAVKGLPDVPGAKEVAGQADALVCPGIDAANILYKTITALIKYGEASLAGITVGFPVPYVILSRADTLSTKLESISLGSVYVQRKMAQEAEATRTTVTMPETPCRVLAINPGSTSVKLAVFEEETCIHEAELPREAPSIRDTEHRDQELAELTQLVRKTMEDGGISAIDAIASRGGFVLRPPEKLAGGTYTIAERQNGGVTIHEDIVSAVRDHAEKDHASNLGIPVAAALAQELGVPAYTVDPVVTDEFDELAEVSGYAGITRRSAAHALSIRAAARRAAAELRLPLASVNLVVAHLGGGITVAAVRGGRIVDNNIALLGGGPFTPCRAGQLPQQELIDLCYSGQYTREELIKVLTKQGGMQSYLDEHRMEAIEERIADGDVEAKRVASAMVYQIAKEIGAMVVAAGGVVGAIVLTGGLARSKWVRDGVRGRVIRLAPVKVFPGSLEMAALAAGARAVVRGEETPREYVLPK